jgi:hypothetical protein
MASHVIIHRRPDALLKPRQAKLRSAKWRLPERPVAIAGFLATVRRHDWMTCEEAQARRRRTLMEDNPTSG